MSTSPTAPSDWVWLARIRRPQGRKGEVFADILTDFPEKFAERRHLWLIQEHGSTGFVSGHDFSRAVDSPKDSGALAPAGVPSLAQSHRAMGGTSQPPPQRAVDLIHHWLHKGGIVLHFAGIDSISAAETLAGLIVAIPHSERAPLADDEVYIADLIGCTLVDVSPDPPQTLGAVEDVDRTAGPAPLLIVNSPRGEILVPFAKSYLRKIDLENRRLEMALPEGLSDLNQS
jgi:16S rRNA processing protein RimM